MFAGARASTEQSLKEATALLLPVALAHMEANTQAAQHAQHDTGTAQHAEHAQHATSTAQRATDAAQHATSAAQHAVSTAQQAQQDRLNAVPEVTPAAVDITVVDNKAACTRQVYEDFLMSYMTAKVKNPQGNHLTTDSALCQNKAAICILSCTKTKRSLPLGAVTEASVYKGSLAAQKS